MKFLLVASTLFSLAVFNLSALSLVKDGKSNYVIVTPEIPACSVEDAAKELQRDITEATGAKLPIVKENEKIDGPFISLGSTQQARQAGVSTEKIADDGFRILTKDGNLFIYGHDTTATLPRDYNWKWADRWSHPNGTDNVVELHPEVPGDDFTKEGGFSTGTANGVYTFLEDIVGVRWLFPGELGRVVPEQKTLEIGEIDRSEAPSFDVRDLTIIWGVNEWRAHQKLGQSFNLHHNHNWNAVVPAEMFDTHPDWFPMINGKRQKPLKGKFKLETTNPEVVKFFAETAVQAFKDRPHLTTFSLSPSDGLGWSESPETMKYIDLPKEGEELPATRVMPISTTRLILKWYRDVSALVAKENPHALLVGYLYSDYKYPPKSGSMELPKNFIPMLVGSNHAYRIYRDDMQQDTFDLLNAWSKVAPDRWYYYGYPTGLGDSQAQIHPAAAKRLTPFYHELVKTGIKGGQIYGTASWSQAALINYIHAKMLWNPKGDAYAIQKDWLVHAYGEKAGAVMEELYDRMDESWWADYFKSAKLGGSAVDANLFAQTYGKHYPEMEAFFLKAWEQPMTDKQRERLDLIRQNFVMLQYRLRKAGLLSADFTSPLRTDAKGIFTLLTDQKSEGSFNNFIHRNGNPVQTIKISTEQAPTVKSEPFPNAHALLLYPTKDQTITIRPNNVHPGVDILTYYVQDSAGKLVTRGVMDDGEEITFEAKADQPYYFSTFARASTRNAKVQWTADIAGAVPSKGVMHKETLYLYPSQQKEGEQTLYAYLPPDLELQLVETDYGSVVRTGPLEEKLSRIKQETAKVATEVFQRIKEEYHAMPLIELNNYWKFKTDPNKEGDRLEFFKTDFDDSAWSPIGTIGQWQVNGFPDYHGTAWYRRTFKLSKSELDPADMEGRKPLLYFGNMDGAAEIYFNGKKIKDWDASAHLEGWQKPVIIDLSDIIEPGENTIAVKVTKDTHAAGICRGVAVMAGVEPKE